jgi:hypothetical protein
MAPIRAFRMRSQAKSSIATDLEVHYYPITLWLLLWSFG